MFRRKPKSNEKICAYLRQVLDRHELDVEWYRALRAAHARGGGKSGMRHYWRADKLLDEALDHKHRTYLDAQDFRCKFAPDSGPRGYLPRGEAIAKAKKQHAHKYQEFYGRGRRPRYGRASSR